MIKKIHIALLILFALKFTASAQKMYVQCGRLIDVTTGTVQSQVTVVIDGKKFLEVRKGFVSGEAGSQTIDLKNKTVLPGLIDCHVHLESQTTKNQLEPFVLTDADIAFRAAIYAKRTLMAGFTTVRDLGGSGVNIALRKAVEQGLTDGPHILTCGIAISATGGHMDSSNGLREGILGPQGPEQGIANGKDELIKAVRYQFKKGADVIKIASTGGVLDLSKDGSGAQFSVDEIKTVVETAKDYGMKVACHAHGAEGIKRAILGGVASIEHGTYMNDEDMQLAKKYGTYLVPTIIAGKSSADSAKIPGYFPAVIVKKALEVGPHIQATFSRAYKAGVKIAFGTDAGVYAHGKNAMEFQYMTEAGMPAMKAIQAATVNAADLLGITDERGSVSAGKYADLIAVNDDPLTNVKTLMNVTFVMKEGKIYKQ